MTGINFLLNAMEMIPQEQVLDSLRLFATEVIPQFQTPAERARPVTTPTTVPDVGQSNAATSSTTPTGASR